MIKITKFLKRFVFQAYCAEHITLNAGERRSSNIISKMVLFPIIYHILFDL